MRNILYFLLSALSITVLSCSEPHVADLMLENLPGETYTITYNRDYGLFIVNRAETKDTLSLWDNWHYALYRYRQQEKNIPMTMNYDGFKKTNFNCLPGSEAQFELLQRDPAAAFNSPDGPGMCDCLDERNEYNQGSAACEEKFQVFRTAYDDSLHWYYSYYLKLCQGYIAANTTLDKYVDSVKSENRRLDSLYRERVRREDSIDAQRPWVTCSGSDFVPAYKRVSSMRIYESCREKTRRPSGRCRRHGG